MKRVLRCVVAVAIALGAQQALAQPVNGCPAGQAMQSSDPSGRNITCVPLGGAETDIIGQWGMTGTTNCIQASGGFDPNTFSPIISTTPNRLSQLATTFIGTRTFYAGGKGRAVGTTHTVSSPQTSVSIGAPSFVGFPGGASIGTLDATFDWRIRADGTLLIEDDNSVAQPITEPPSSLGATVTIKNMPPFVGYISKDKRTILMQHAAMAMETSEFKNPSGATFSTPRFCIRSRVLTRLP
jgi:hypothetical protein